MLNLPLDFGPIYAETNMNRFPVEPWNTYSNLIFLAIFLYYAWKTRFRFSEHKLLTLCLPILFIGYIGGTLYHATRTNRIWLLMDFVPISILCLMTALYYWNKILGKVWKVFFFVLLPFFLLRFLLRAIPLDRNILISVGYSFMGAFLIAPLFLYSKQKPQLRKILGFATLAFAIAIFFRIVDSANPPYLSMGTHWLWHLFGGIASFFAITFVYADDLLCKSRP